MHTTAVVLNLVLCAFIFIASLYYFVKVKTVWRWIKLTYAANAALLFLLGLDYLMGWFPIPRELQFVTQTILLSTIASGLLVAQAKLQWIAKGATNAHNPD